MQKYKDLNHDSGVHAFELAPDGITVQFTTGALYKYTNQSAGADKIDTMKRLALLGDGLNAYINYNKPGFTSKRH